MGRICLCTAVLAWCGHWGAAPAVGQVTDAGSVSGTTPSGDVRGGGVSPPEAPGSVGPVLHPDTLRLLGDRGGAPIKAWVLFRDKGSPTRAALQQQFATLRASYNPRSIARRQRRRSAPGLFDERDLPVEATYVRQVAATGAEVRVVSPWVNGISVVADESQLRAIGAFGFVRSVQPVRRSALRRPVDVVPRVGFGSGSGPRALISYGNSFSQLDQIDIPAAHTAGFTGAGIVIGILDTGFHRTHEAFNEPGHVLNVTAEHDFVDGDGNADIDPGDPPGQQNHGTYILGTIGGYKPGIYVGGAFDASFVLAKTEDITQEVMAEEDNYVAGLQFIEANGADMATSSLGYIDWYTQADLDGLTAVTTVAVNVATDNGLVCVTAAGNSGNDADPLTSHLIAPADAFQVITVGAVNVNGGLVSFSSDGPTADGRVKPEVLALGLGTVTVNPGNDTAYLGVSGTSLSTPLVAAAVACLLQAHPDWTVDQVRNALTTTASRYVTTGTFQPTFKQGYGVVDCFAAINTTPGDSDGDGDLDAGDYAAFQSCVHLAGVPIPLWCGAADVNADGRVATDDVVLLQSLLTGPN